MRYKSDAAKHDSAPRLIGNMIKEVRHIATLHDGEIRPELDNRLQHLAAVTQQLIESRHV